MANIHNIKVFIIEDWITKPDFSLFDVAFAFDDLFIGLAVQNDMILGEINICSDGANYNILDLIDLPNYHMGEVFDKCFDVIISFTGIKLEINDILDIMNGDLVEKIDDDVIEFDIHDRRIYLESMLYYKSNQDGKEINGFSIRVEGYDEFLSEFEDDIITCVVISHEKFIYYNIDIETYLTLEEMNEKFEGFLVD